MGIASMVASLGAMAYLATSGIASAEDRVIQAARVEKAESTAEKADTAEKAPPAKVVAARPRKVPPARKKHLDMGRFEGY
jgi:hypothetical protein